MSKSRVTRKGRVAHAIAQHLESVRTRLKVTANGNGDGPNTSQNAFLDLGGISTAQQTALKALADGDAGEVVQANGLRIGYHKTAEAALRISLDSDTKEDVIKKTLAFMKGQGTGGQLFAEGQSIGAIADAVNTADSSPNLFSANETAAVGANVAGEAGVAAQANHAGLSGASFKHHYFQHKAAFDTDNATTKNAALGVARTAGNPLTSKSGIIYLPSGPAADYMPANHGDKADEVYAVSIRPDLTELTAAGETLNNIRYSILGVAGGYLIDGQYSQHQVATSVVKIHGEAVMTKASGAEIRVLDESAATLLSLKFLASGDADPSDASKTITSAAAGGATNYIVSSATQIYLLQGSDANVTSNADMAQNMKAAIDAWNLVYGTGITVARAGADLTFSNNRLKGLTGNAGGGATKTQANTITAYVTKFGAQQPVDNTVGAAEKLIRTAGDADADFIPFASGTTDTVTFNQDGPEALNAAVAGGKFIATDLDLCVTLKNTTTAVPGIALVWSLA